jgi:tetratricopeptide (TPR) repeat protein
LNKFPIVLLALLCAATAQSTRPPAKARPQSMKRPAQAAAAKLPPELEKAEAAIAQKDFATAEPLLLQEIKNNPQDFRAWYNLGFVYYQTQRIDHAIDAYKRSIGLRGDLEQTHAALGLVLFEQRQNDAAIPHLRKAAELKPSSQAWMTLGAAQEKNHPQDAVASYAKAAALAPDDPEPHARAGILYEQQHDWPHAEREYLAAQKIKPSSEVLAGLVNVYQQTHRGGEAESTLREYLKLQPEDARAHLQLGRLLLAQGKKDDAALEFDAVRAGRSDLATLRQLAGEFFAAKDYPHAVEIYRELVAQSPREADLRHRLGSALLYTKDYAEAEKELIAAANLDPKDPEVLGSLAIAASNNNHHELAIKALDTRAKVTAETPSTYFLRATSYDHLQQYKPAAENYRLFLAAANGAYPDEEWKARHRLIAIAPDGGNKKR